MADSVESCTRHEKMHADADAAKAKFLSTGGHRTDHFEDLRILSIDLEDETLAFEVSEYQGQFTAFLSESYPVGKTSIYGPDDMELDCAGSILQILDKVLDKLASRKRSRKSVDTVSSPALCCDDDSVHSQSADSQDGDDHDDAAHWVLEDTPMEPLLSAHVESARLAAKDSEAVHVSQLSVDLWRLRLRVPSVNGEGGPLLDDYSCQAWGLTLERPIWLQIHLPTRDYLDVRKMPDRLVLHVYQEDTESFILTKQLANLLQEFYQWYLGRGCPHVEHIPGLENLGEEAMPAVLQEFHEKKMRLMAEARASEAAGFLAHFVRYCQLRIPTLHEFCAICDQPFHIPPMFMRTVCCREICTYLYREHGEALTSAGGVNAQAEIVDVLFCIMMHAALHKRRDDILDPYPTVHVDGCPDQEAFHPQRKDFPKLETTVKALQTLRKESAPTLGAAWTTQATRMSPEGNGLMKWVFASNRSYLSPLQEEQMIAQFKTPFQYLLISAPPEKERSFQELKAKHGSTFAFHGSPAENWHSIMRNGLKSATKTKLQLHGAAYGAGIYLASDLNTSMNYAVGATRVNMKKVMSAKPLDQQHRPGNRPIGSQDDVLIMVAVAEVINEEAAMKKFKNIWVCNSEEHVLTRFFLVYTDLRDGRDITMTDELKTSIEALMERLNVGIRIRKPSPEPAV
eukprot:TRINITY_DN51245_c0_g2_i1.p1 TRINITY_DN51245_c0_g2~~TRINITY_DN51245_c0_g2_i1.p1  ORF type:complete len:705 (+),score=112.00 TRINITY_DN51245_c0_g2_i1:69-2117(+)